MKTLLFLIIIVNINFKRCIAFGNSYQCYRSMAILPLKSDSVRFEYWQRIDKMINSSGSETEVRALSELNLQFFLANGELIIYPSVKGTFRPPLNEKDFPIINIYDSAYITNGTYEHELRHFKTWLTNKRKLIEKGYSEEQAHTALGRQLLADDIAHLANSAFFIEGDTTFKSDFLHPHMFAISNIARATPDFINKIRTPDSETRKLVIQHMKAILLECDNLIKKGSVLDKAVPEFIGNLKEREINQRNFDLFIEEYKKEFEKVYTVFFRYLENYTPDNLKSYSLDDENFLAIKELLNSEEIKTKIEALIKNRWIQFKLLLKQEFKKQNINVQIP